ncbi:hypothetical protein CCR75_000905 [Bremia lactucae]|uniref:Uncharacterized protein n=1 Tax=Bremia lactucae TaxID=4779 RepID=A0A976FLY7_BRELC|nr:hypothetical protein CCR75_000905 [Bremia lactucae]
MEQFDGTAPRNHVEAEAREDTKKHRKDKPWDSDDIDHWKIDPWHDEIPDETNTKTKCLVFSKKALLPHFFRNIAKNTSGKSGQLSPKH